MGTTIEVHVSETDAFTLHLEQDPLLRSTIVAVAVLDRTPDWDDLVLRMERATRITPTFRQKLVPSPLRLAPPRWIVDPAFDLHWHLRRAAVPEGGGLDEVIEFARTAGMAAFDHDRPLWEFTVLEGLADGRAALVMKVHHALTDGIGGIQLAADVIDLERDGRERRPLPDEPHGGEHPPGESLVDALAYDARQIGRAGFGLVRRAPANAAVWLSHPVRTAGEAVDTVRSIGRMVRPVTETRSPVMTDRQLRWHYQCLDIPFEDLRRAGRAIDGTLNDAFLGGLSGGLRRYHEALDAPVDRLRVTMPISIRTDLDGPGGNHITLVRFEAPVGTVDPVERMREIHALCLDAREESAIPYSNQIAAVLNLLPVRIAGDMLKHVDLLASNVPGFDGEVFVSGARVDGFYAFGPTTGAAANVTLMSYNGVCHIGITTDAGAVPDPDAFTEALRAGFDEVIAAGR